MEMAKLFQTELEHYEKVEGDNLSLDGKANKLGPDGPDESARRPCMGLAGGADLRRLRREGRRWAASSSTTSRAAATRRRDYDAQGSGSKDARDSLKKLWQRDMPRDEAVRVPRLEALIDAADEDVGTGGPIWCAASSPP